MLKRNELSNPNSCLNKAGEDEPIFVLRAKDAAAVAAVQAWIDERVKLGLNRPDDAKVIEALDWRDDAEEWRMTVGAERYGTK